MKTTLTQPINKRFENVDVEIGDKVRIVEWDGITVEGVVKEVSKDKISIHHGKFLSGCYRECDYSIYKQQTDFTFNLRDVASIEVATFDGFSPLTLIHLALSENYCGSEELVMSPLFYESLKTYMRRHVFAYYGLPVRVDEKLIGYCVYAVPNERSKKHKETPMIHFTIHFYKRGKWMASRVCSAFPDEYDSKVDEEKGMFVRRIGGAFAYKVEAEGRIIERGNATQRFPIRQQ
jgi:hypothetical protein